MQIIHHDGSELRHKSDSLERKPIALQTMLKKTHKRSLGRRAWQKKL